MHVHSFLPALGLTLVTRAIAQSPPTPALDARDATPTVCEDLPPKWTAGGCFFDDPSSRTLKGPNYCDDTGLNEVKCIEFCDAQGYSWAGVEFGQECYCGYGLHPATQTADSDCDMPCVGSPDQVCGAGGRLNVFSNGSPEPTTAPSAGDYTSLGCYTDSASSRILTTTMPLSGLVRVSDCTSACSAAGFPYAGLEFGDECYCGSEISNNGALASDSSICDMACSADGSEWCGGAGAINVYQNPNIKQQSAAAIPTGWRSEGCYSDNVSGRTLSVNANLDGSSMTVEGCINACSGMGYSLAGVEYARECYCDNSIQNAAVLMNSGCDMPCTGNNGEVCGGAARINLYTDTPVPAPVVTAPTCSPIASFTSSASASDGQKYLTQPNTFITNDGNMVAARGYGIYSITGCLDYCENTPNCRYITYSPDYDYCELYADLGYTPCQAGSTDFISGKKDGVQK